MPLFDPTIFDPLVFDTGSAPIVRSGVERMRRAAAARQSAKSRRRQAMLMSANAAQTAPAATSTPNPSVDWATLARMRQE